MATAPTTPPADGAALPTPPSTSDPVNFAARGDAYFLAQVDFQAEMNLLKANVYTNATGAYANAVEANTRASAAATSAATAATYAGASAWVSNTTYAISDKRWSLINGWVYRRLTVGAGTTDPSLDATNWELYSTVIPTQLVSGLTQQMISGAEYAAINTTTQGAATNIIPWSEDFTAWLLTGAGSVSSNSIMAPDGLTTADTLTDSDATIDSAHFSKQQTVPNDSATYTTSVFLKQGTAAATFVNAYFVGGTTVTAGLVVTWGATPSIAASGAGTNPLLVYVGNGWYRASINSANNSTGNVSQQTRIYPAGSNAAVTGSVYAWGAQAEVGTVATSYIPTGAAAASRSAGVVAPTRFILPASPGANAFGRVLPVNGITTNVVDPNGQTIEGQPGPINLDDGPLSFKFINGTWRVFK